jgi:hypothetical protein
MRSPSAAQAVPDLALGADNCDLEWRYRDPFVFGRVTELMLIHAPRLGMRRGMTLPKDFSVSGFPVADD